MAIKNKKYMEHWKYGEKTKAMTNEQLHFTILDARDAIAANPNGINSDYYADEINYCAMELHRRRQHGQISDTDWRLYR